MKKLTMRHAGLRTYYTPIPPKMPLGLVELMEGMTKEVLRHNPSDIYSFCASHVEQLLEKRDGPSCKKSLSLEEKIIKVQKKVNERAAKRRQEYDSNLLLQTQDNSDVNSDLTLQVPKLIAPQGSTCDTDADVNNATPPQEQNFLKAPIHHEFALDKSSEVEISHASDLNILTPMENLTNDSVDSVHDINVKTNQDLNDRKDTITNEDSIPSKNEAKENEVKHDTTNTPETETTNGHIVNFEIEKATDKDALGSSPEMSIVIEQSDIKNKNNDDIVPQELLKSGDGITLRIDSSKNILNDMNKEEVVVIAHEDKNIIKIVVEDHAQNAPEKENTDDVQKVENNSGIHKSNITNEETQILNTDKIEKNNIKDTHAENYILLSTQKEDSGQSVDITENTNKENISSVAQESNIDKDDEDVKQSNNTATSNLFKDIEISPIANSSDISNKQQDIEDKHLNSIDKEEMKEPTPVVETDSNFDLPTQDVDSDIKTLITENTLNETDQTNDLHIETSHIREINTSQVEKEHIDLDKENSNSDLHDIEDNPTDTIKHVSNESAHTIEADNDDRSKRETLSTVSENTQNDSHDSSHMDLETAAVTIQKVFRTFLFKSRGSTFEDTANDEANYLNEDDKNKEECGYPIASTLNIDRRAHGITRMDTVLQTVNEEKSLSLSDDSSTLSSAATIIQAHVRGFLTRNKLNSNKTMSTNSLAASNSNEPSITSLEADNEQNKIKTVLNIHIVPGGENYLSRDESLITSMELSLDSSPPSSINLHPLGYDKSERRKQLKREDAIQSISPPTNNSGKLSEDIDSVKELSLNDQESDQLHREHVVGDNNFAKDELDQEKSENIPIENDPKNTVTETNEEIADSIKNILDNSQKHLEQTSFIKMNSDEMDVVTPFITNEDSVLIHSGEFHDAVLPTRVSRSDTSVVSEFKNVLVYFLLWNHT